MLPTPEQVRTVRALSPTKRLAQAPTIMSSSSWQPIGASFSNTRYIRRTPSVFQPTRILPNLLTRTSRPPASQRQLHNLKRMDRLVLRPGLARPIRINSARSRRQSSPTTPQRPHSARSSPAKSPEFGTLTPSGFEPPPPQPSPPPQQRPRTAFARSQLHPPADYDPTFFSSPRFLPTPLADSTLSRSPSPPRSLSPPQQRAPSPPQQPTPQPPKSPKLIFTTLFQRPAVATRAAAATTALARKRPLSAAEQREYFFTGLTSEPGYLRSEVPPEPEPADEHAAAIASAKRHVDQQIMRREMLIVEIRNLLPRPSNEAEARQVLSNPHDLIEKRAQLASLLHEVRETSSTIVHGIAYWRTKLRVASGHYRRLPDDEIIFWHGGAPGNTLSIGSMIPHAPPHHPHSIMPPSHGPMQMYPAKLATDLNLSSTIGNRPIVHRMVLGTTAVDGRQPAKARPHRRRQGAHRISSRSRACDTTAEPDSLASAGSEDPATIAIEFERKRERHKLEHAQRVIRGEAVRRGLHKTPGVLLREAHKRARSSSLRQVQRH